MPAAARFGCLPTPYAWQVISCACARGSPRPARLVDEQAVLRREPDDTPTRVATRELRVEGVRQGDHVDVLAGRIEPREQIGVIARRHPARRRRGREAVDLSQ